MQQSVRKLSVRVLLAVTVMFAFAFMSPSQVQAAAGLRISTPIVPDSGLLVVYDPILDLGGTLQGLSKGVTLKSISCESDQGKVGIATVTAYSYVSGGTDPTYGTFSWTAQVELATGDNIITMNVLDSNGNTYTESIQAYYIPYTPSGIQEFLTDYRTKAKFTFYYTAAYKNLDRFSIVGYLAKAKTDPWCLPFTKEVTVSVSAHSASTGEDILLFTQTIPKNSVTGTSKYRYLSRKAGIQELTLEKSKYTDTCLYLFVDKLNMLASQKASMTAAAYKAFIQSLDSFTITFTAGDAVWVGTAPLVDGSYTTVKQEMVFNR